MCSSTAGVYVSQFGNGVLHSVGVPNTVAVNEFTGDAYVGVETEGKSVVDVFESAGGLIPPEWEGASTRTGSFGVDSVAVGIDPSTIMCT